ncbi:MAG: GNAT family N-acetyltransferase [Gemmatimonadota bacterium]|nr:GNAT family N-acetyltransferase [Gemmatimonadota bacterium]MDH5805458.1 GNAT family N-acetyltransferase [Gemmatimonadota bacterium]
MAIDIRPMTEADWSYVSAIYKEGIETEMATFETEVPSWDVWNETHLPKCRLVAEDENKIVLGWVALSSVSDRCVYGGVTESSVYVAAEARGRGVGRKLMDALVQESEREGIWTIQAGMFAENDATVALHRSVGFRKVGLRERLGKLHGKWRDVLLMERRSTKVGVD